MAASSGKCVVRLRTSAWVEAGAVSIKKRISILRKQSTPENVLYSAMDSLNADELAERFINAMELPDGIYQVVPCNIQKDWETGNVDDYDFKLIPIEECVT